MTQTSVNQRIKILIKELDLSSRAFSASIDSPDATTRNYIDGRSKPSSDYLEKIIRRYAHINAGWLLTGDGTMFLDTQAVAEPTTTYVKTNSGNNIGTNTGAASMQVSNLDDYKKDLKAANDKINLLTNQIKDKERIIQLLEMQLKK